jgi:hypothetical protein
MINPVLTQTNPSALVISERVLSIPNTDLGVPNRLVGRLVGFSGGLLKLGNGFFSGSREVTRSCRNVLRRFSLCLGVFNQLVGLVTGTAHLEPLHEREEHDTDGQNHNRDVSPLRAIRHGVILAFGFLCFVRGPLLNG